MKRLRITFEGAFHHTMNRGINGEEIFSGDNNKAQIIKEEYKIMKNLAR